jgi:hypothetical protein
MRGESKEFDTPTRSGQAPDGEKRETIGLTLLADIFKTL